MKFSSLNWKIKNILIHLKIKKNTMKISKKGGKAFKN